MVIRLILGVGLLGIAGCTTSVPVTPPAPENPIPYTLDLAGVQLVGQSLRIDFGRTDHSTERAMNKLVGQPPSSRAVCADGRPYLVWPDGARLYFSDGAFRGWVKLGEDGTVQQAGSVCT